MGCFLICWQNNYKFHLKSNCVRMAKNFPLRKTKRNHSKREVMISCTHFQTQVGWEPGSAARPPSLACRVQLSSRRVFLYTASVRLHLSTASHGWASPQKGGPRSQMCTGASQTGVRAGSRYRERNFTTEGSKAHTETQVISQMGKREKPGETQKLTNQWKSLWGYSKVIQ